MEHADDQVLEPLAGGAAVRSAEPAAGDPPLQS
jgi:hypothetical protein